MSTIIDVYPQVVEVLVTGGVGPIGPQGVQGPQGPVGPQGPPGDGSVRVELTADTTLDTVSGTVYTNAATPVVATLPPSASIGSAVYKARFRLTAAALLRVQAQGSDVIRYYGQQSIAAGYLEISERDAVLDVEYVGANVFLVTNALMQWSFGP
jgi:hypothetical protein